MENLGSHNISITIIIIFNTTSVSSVAESTWLHAHFWYPLRRKISEASTSGLFSLGLSRRLWFLSLCGCLTCVASGCLTDEYVYQQRADECTTALMQLDKGVLQIYYYYDLFFTSFITSDFIYFSFCHISRNINPVVMILSLLTVVCVVSCYLARETDTFFPKIEVIWTANVVCSNEYFLFDSLFFLSPNAPYCGYAPKAMASNAPMMGASVTSFGRSIAMEEIMHSTTNHGSHRQRQNGALSAEEVEEGRPVHPSSRELFKKCGGRMNCIRNIPIFGEAIECYNLAFVTSLCTTYTFSKGIAYSIVERHEDAIKMKELKVMVQREAATMKQTSDDDKGMFPDHVEDENSKPPKYHEDVVEEMEEANPIFINWTTLSKKPHGLILFLYKKLLLLPAANSRNHKERDLVISRYIYIYSSSVPLLILIPVICYVFGKLSEKIFPYIIFRTLSDWLRFKSSLLSGTNRTILPELHCFQLLLIICFPFVGFLKVRRLDELRCKFLTLLHLNFHLLLMHSLQPAEPLLAINSVRCTSTPITTRLYWQNRSSFRFSLQILRSITGVVERFSFRVCFDFLFLKLFRFQVSTLTKVHQLPLVTAMEGISLLYDHNMPLFVFYLTPSEKKTSDFSREK
eukprot:gene9065-6363_t